jgi:hypothetical protein
VLWLLLAGGVVIGWLLDLAWLFVGCWLDGMDMDSPWDVWDVEWSVECGVWSVDEWMSGWCVCAMLFVCVAVEVVGDSPRWVAHPRAGIVLTSPKSSAHTSPKASAQPPKAAHVLHNLEFRVCCTELEPLHFRFVFTVPTERAMPSAKQMSGLIGLCATLSLSHGLSGALAASADFVADTTRIFPSPYSSAGAEASNASSAVDLGRSSCIVRVLECFGVQYSNLNDRVNCFIQEIENTVNYRAVSLVSAFTPHHWRHWPFEHGVVALIMNTRTVSVVGGCPEDRCGYSRGTPPEREKCHGTPQRPEEYAYDRLKLTAASCGQDDYCSIAKRAGNCFTSKEDAWRKNAIWLRYWRNMAQHAGYPGGTIN